MSMFFLDEFMELHGRGLYWNLTSPEGPNQNLAGMVGLTKKRLKRLS